MRLSVYIQAAASKSELAGLYQGALKLRIAARAAEGEANEEICRFLAQLFDVSKSSVSILKGKSSKRKVVFVPGDFAALRATLLASLERISKRTTWDQDS